MQKRNRLRKKRRRDCRRTRGRRQLQLRHYPQPRIYRHARRRICGASVVHEQRPDYHGHRRSRFASRKGDMENRRLQGYRGNLYARLVLRPQKMPRTDEARSFEKPLDDRRKREPHKAPSRRRLRYGLCKIVRQRKGCLHDIRTRFQ